MLHIDIDADYDAHWRHTAMPTWIALSDRHLWHTHITADPAQLQAQRESLFQTDIYDTHITADPAELQAQRESLYLTDICDAHITLGPAELQAQSFMAFTDISRNQFVRTNIHTTEGTVTDQLGSSDAKREHNTRAGSVYHPQRYVTA
jgi:hypothetical protein